MAVADATLKQAVELKIRSSSYVAPLLAAVLLLLPAGTACSQNFGWPGLKSKAVLQRKLPALVQLPAGTVSIVVTGHSDSRELTQDFKTMLGTELIKQDPRLSTIDGRGDSSITCQITAFDHPPATKSTRPGIQTGKTAPPPITYTRVTGIMRVSFQAHSRSGKSIGSDNVIAKYDEEFDSSGNTLSGGITKRMKHTVDLVKGGAQEDMDPPTDAELRTKLLTEAVQKIVVQLVNTRETVEVELAKGKGPMGTGVKEAEGGLWTRALETWETMPPLPRPVDDAYRLYDVGVANEALGYAADNYQSATKFLDEAAIDYGKAIDDNPGEKYFIAPQKRIEAALAHYHKLQEQTHAPAPAAATTPKSASIPKKHPAV